MDDIKLSLVWLFENGVSKYDVRHATLKILTIMGHDKYRVFRKDQRRYMRAIIYRTAKRCMEFNGISYVRNEEMQDAIALIGQVGAQFNYKIIVIRQAIYSK